LQDGYGTSSVFCNPTAVAYAPNGSYCLIADSNDHVIRRLDVATRLVTTVAGNRGKGNSLDQIPRDWWPSLDGVGTNAIFYYPTSIVVSKDGEFALIPESGWSSGRIRRLAISTGQVTTLRAWHTLRNGTTINPFLIHSNGIAISPNTSCSPCPAGQAAVGPSCETCGPGTYAALGASACRLCGHGQYQTGSGMSYCAFCGPGKYHVRLGMAQDVCVNWRAGKNASPSISVRLSAYQTAALSGWLSL
jgi:hypothetical protein